MRYFIIAGEASGDLHASNLIKALREVDADAQFCFMGGDLMAEAANQQPVVHYSAVAYMGFVPVLKHLGEIAGAAKKVQNAMREFAPDVVIPVDFGSFNFRYILPFVHDELHTPIFYYIAPKVWAWKKWRVRTLKKYVHTLLCILPFEVDFFTQRGVNAIYVGNPCVDAVMDFEHQGDAPSALDGIPEGARMVALLCGSRKQEVADNLPTMLRAMDGIDGPIPVIAGAPGLTMADYEPYIGSHTEAKVVFGQTYQLLAQSEAAMVTSGTATLETCLLGTPQVVCYRATGNPVIAWGFKYLFPIKYFSLVNLIANKTIVPELLAHQVTPKRVREALTDILPGKPARDKQLMGYGQVQAILGQERTSAKAANEIYLFLKE